ncbi:hypothetical protein H8R23_14165 [Flavobacterium sp. F-380]|jgi:hypothetical protein|uniref:Uncharacterized protein n=1 Tax=Flavobacterium kayseriense TaxID=2764714 RepID=A0ABR7JAJ0_9FLAO|nr:DUF6428 family protein [Flavobacterium kayseriense]MBC5842554.1 hypothetical protein [Flavobacterium kayseriense]MBC5849084.1 hypothetical protein [Flavobacterium kayseriense]
MKLSEIKKVLATLDNVAFQLPNGTFVPEHFHVTEVGLITRNFIDCGGKVRKESVVNFQLWNANDLDHRLKPKKLMNIISLSERTLGILDNQIEVEYQSETIGKYDLDFNGNNFVLVNKQTACLAEDQCGIPQKESKTEANSNQQNTCTPGGGCC